MIFNVYPNTDFHEMNIDWLIKTVKDIMIAVDTLDDWKTQHEEEYEQLKEFYDALMEGIIPPELETTLKHWIQENAVSIVGEMVKMVRFECTADGHLIARIPDSWTDIQFGTTGLDKIIAGYDYGHLYISY